MKNIIYTLLITSSISTALASKCPEAIIKKVAYPYGSGEAKIVIKLVDDLLAGNPNCGQKNRPLITYYGEHHNHGELSKLIKHYEGKLDLDAQTDGEKFHILHIAAENPFQLSDEIFWHILSHGSKIDPINKVTGLTPLLTIAGPGASLTSATTLRKIYLSLMFGANSTELVHRVLQNYTYSSTGAKTILSLILDPEEYFNQSFAQKFFSHSSYKEDLIKLIDHSTVQAINPQAFCQKAYSLKHKQHLNAFEYLKAEKAWQGGKRNHITEYVEEMQRWLEEKSIQQEMCK